ncbi:O-antigen ligase family protein [Faecalibaculum rodentium]|uniref:O-antigen ligase family protein n=1 Tax=Faecalibaculum rodentium TaxID=1702221 RepID=UPI001F5A489B|nr:O-antigen ligase family protein [Faecalibaculum rodentium]
MDNTKKENSFDVFWHFGVISWVVNIITSICLFAVFGVSKRAYGMIGSTYICFFLPFIMYGFFMPTNSRQKKKYLVLSILSILSSIISQQRTLMILCLLNAVIYILIDKRNIIKNSVKFILLGFGVALVIFYIAPPSLMEMLIRKWNELFLASNNTATGSMANRYVLWRAAINMIKQKPLFGIGSGVFSRLQIFELKQFTIGAAIEDAAGLSTHNFLLEYLVELGAIGTLITYSIVVVILKKVLSLRKNIGNRTLYISILSSIITLTIYDLFGQGTFLPFWNYVAILGVLYAEKERYKSRDILYM